VGDNRRAGCSHIPVWVPVFRSLMSKFTAQAPLLAAPRGEISPGPGGAPSHPVKPGLGLLGIGLEQFSVLCPSG